MRHVIVGNAAARRAEGLRRRRGHGRGDASYRETLPSTALKVDGVSLLAAGAIDPEGALDCAVQKEPDRGVYRRLVFRDDILVGCIHCGGLRGERKILSALLSGLRKADRRQLMEDSGFPA